MDDNGQKKCKTHTFKITPLKTELEKQKMPKEKRAIGKRLSANALFFGFVFSSFYVFFSLFFFFHCLSGQVLGVCLAAERSEALVLAKHTPKNNNITHKYKKGC